jgi:two-component sensor histidine kinase
VELEMPNEGSSAMSAEQRYKALFDNMVEGFAICEAILDPEGRVHDYWVRAANPMFVRRAPDGEEMVGRRQREIRPSTSDLWFDACDRALAGHPVRFEFLDALSDRWYEVHMTRLSDREFAQFFVDITERKRAERRQAALFEELNHRVKNNLAVVSAILELQARESPTEVREQLGKAVDRIRAMHDLYAALYDQKSSEHVELCPYVEDLRERLERTLFHDRNARLKVLCDRLAVPVREAVGLGLIVNELVTNAAKHAIPEGAGEIRLTLRAEGDALKLRVEDDGPGFPRRSGDEGLGLRVVRSLAESMHGEVSILAGPGARVEVTLPIPVGARHAE